MEQLEDVTEVVIVEADIGLPDPLTVDSSLVATGGEEAFEHQALFIRVENVSVTEFPVVSDHHTWETEFRVDGGLIVGNQFGHDYAVTVGDTFQSITGTLRLRHHEYRLEPWSDDDIVLDTE